MCVYVYVYYDIIIIKAGQQQFSLLFINIYIY